MMPAGYSLSEEPLPDDAELEIGGMDTRESGTVVVSTRHGEIWEYDPDATSWTRVTNSLHNALGVWVDDDSGDIFTTQMPALTRVIDEDGDGTAERYETITDEWGFSSNYHEFAFGPVRDSEGNFYLNLNLTEGAGGTVKEALMGAGSAYRGWAIKVTPDGEFIPCASGLRSPSGIGINGNDEVFITDNEGDYMPANHLSHLREGEFYGHPASLKDHPAFEDRNLDDIPNGEYDDMRTDHAVWVPREESFSTTGPAFDTAGNFGPFDGQVFMGELTQAKVLRASLETVDGQYQGALFNFGGELTSGPTSLTFSPDGSTLWIGETTRGWGSTGYRPYGLQRIEYDGETTPFEMHSVHIQPSGFDIEFTRPVDPATVEDPAGYDISHFGWDNNDEYGSDRMDTETITTDEIEVSVGDDDTVVTLSLPEIYVTPPDEAGILGDTRVYEIALSNVHSADGESLQNSTTWYTVNTVPS